MDNAVVGVGDVIGGRYRIEGLLGQGGMAVVYRARHTGTGRECALKVILPHLAARPGVVDMFVREAGVGGRIGSHPHIVDVFDTGIDDQRRLPFLAMELLRGDTVAQMIARGPIARTLMGTLVEQLGDALQQAHDAGVVHRDLKPGNLLVTADRKGNPVLKVLDFGIAKVLEGDLQRTATEIGTPAYAAPEQLGPTFREIARAQGVAVAAQVSPATDIWALGLIAYEAMTGAPAGQYWGATTASDLPLRMALALRGAETASARAAQRSGLLPSGFDPWFSKCLQIDASRRWQSAAEAAAELVRCLSRPAAGARPAPGLAETSVAGAVDTFVPQRLAPGAPPARPVESALAAPETNLGAQVSTLMPEEPPGRSVASPVAGRRNLLAAGIAAAIGVCAIAFSGFLLLGRSSASVPVAESASASVAAAPSEPPSVEQAASAPAEPAAPASAAAVVAGRDRDRPGIAVGAETARTGTKPDSPQPQKTGPAAGAMTSPLGQAAGETTASQPASADKPFDRSAAASAMGAAAGAAAGCKMPDGPTGTGRASVTFAPDGTASAVSVNPPFAGTPVGGCVASRFRSVRVPPFSGGPMTVHKSFTIP